MYIRPKLDSKHREQTRIARSRFSARAYMLTSRSLSTDPLAFTLYYGTDPTGQMLPTFLSGNGWSKYMPETVDNGLSSTDIERLTALDRGGADPVEIDGVQMSSREAARNMLRPLIPSYDEFVSVMSTAWVEKEDPTKIHYFMDTKVGWRQKSLSVTKFLQMLNHKYKFRFPADVIEEIASGFGRKYKEPKLVFMESSEVYETYEQRSFGSCMSGHSSVMFYDEQPNAKVLRIETEDGMLRGRAILWTNVRRYSDTGKLLDKGLTILDRIYPSDGGEHIDAAIAYAKKNGWVYKTDQSIGRYFSEPGDYEVDIYDNGNYPYMDTFSRSDVDNNVLMCTHRAQVRRGYEDIHHWQSTCGNSPAIQHYSSGGARPTDEDEGDNDE